MSLILLVGYFALRIFASSAATLATNSMRSISRRCLEVTRSRFVKNFGVIFGKPTCGIGAKIGVSFYPLFGMESFGDDMACYDILS